jgi:hypothetical protein
MYDQISPVLPNPKSTQHVGTRKNSQYMSLKVKEVVPHRCTILRLLPSLMYEYFDSRKKVFIYRVWRDVRLVFYFGASISK